MDPAAEAAPGGGDPFCLPTASANLTMRSATSSGCSATLVECVTTPGRMTFPSGSFTSRQIFHSCSCRALAASNEYAPALIASRTSWKTPKPSSPSGR